MNCADCEQYNSENVCCSCENLPCTKLKQENKILKESLLMIGTYKCPKCGYYSLLDFKCFNCRHDRSITEELDNG